MSWVPAEQVLATVASHRQVLDEQHARLASAAIAHAAERQKLDAERAQAARDLAQALLPRFDRSSIATAAQQVGLVGLPGEDLPGKLEARRAWLQHRMREILADPRYAQAELLRHPRTGSLTTAIAEAEELRGPANEVLTRCRAHPRFARLLDLGFGAQGYEAPWWRYSHWLDRSAAQEILAGFPGKTSFGDVRREYDRALETVTTYDLELAHLRAEVAAGEALEREYGTLYGEHQHIDAGALDYARDRVMSHMLTSDASLMSQRLAALPDLRLLFLRASGIAAKLSYLDGLERSTVQEAQKEIAAAKEKLDGIEARTRKRWAPMPLDKYQKLAVDWRPRYEKRWQRYGKVYSSVSSFNRWDRGSRYDDLLWWDLMTRGRYDGAYLPDVAEFHRLHPDYAFDATLLQGSYAAPAPETLPALPDVPDDQADAAAHLLGVEAQIKSNDLVATDVSNDLVATDAS